MKWVVCEQCGQTSCILEEGVTCLRFIAPGEVCLGTTKLLHSTNVDDKKVLTKIREVKKLVDEIENELTKK